MDKLIRIIFVFGLLPFVSFEVNAQAVTVTKNDSTVIQRNVASKRKSKKPVLVNTTLRKKPSLNNSKEVIYDPKLKPKKIIKETNK